jgi:hypothetical protein
MLHYLQCAWAAFSFEWLSFTRRREQHFLFLHAVPTAVLIAYIAGLSDRPIAQANIFFANCRKAGRELRAERVNGRCDTAVEEAGRERRPRSGGFARWPTSLKTTSWAPTWRPAIAMPATW